MPQNWKTYTMGELVDLKQGLAINKKSNHLLCEKGKEATPLFKIRDLIKGTIEHYVKRDEVPKQCLVEPDELIYSRTGQVGYVFKGKTGCMHNNCFKITPNELVTKEFLFQFLSSPVIRQYANDIASGSVQKDLNHTAFKSITISIPENAKEQTAIASILSTIDAKIENNLAINKTLEEMAMALYKEWFVDFGPFQEGEFVESELGMIPEGWEVKRLEEVLEIKYGKDHKKLADGTIPVYGSGGVMRYVDTFLYDEDSILIPRKGTLSNLFYVTEPFWSVDTMFYSKIKQKEMGHYLFHFLKCLDLAGMDVGSAVPSLTTALLKRLNVLIPPIKQIEKFDNVATKYFEERMSNKSQNQTLTTLRDTLLPKLISGEVRLNEFRDK